jgi:hypothetical protein
MKKDMKNLKKEYVIILFIILCILNIIDSYKFLNGINNGEFSMQDILIYSIYGLNENERTNLIDIVKCSIPYILIFWVNAIYFSNVLDEKVKYLHIIRYKSLKIWLKEKIKKLLQSTILLITVYYAFLIIIALIFIKNRSGFTDTFYILNPYYTNHGGVIQLIIYQYILTLTSVILLTSIQLLISILINNIHRVFIYLNFSIIVLISSGIKNMYNPIMLSKHNVINSTINVSVVDTITVEIIIGIFVYLYIIKNAKLVVRSETK